MNNCISIIIPTYNNASSLPEALDSCLSQKGNFDLEIVVIDDGSTDNTYDVIKQYTHYNNIRYFYQPNSGASAARNKGIIESIGEYICFLDADDILLENSIFLRKYIFDLRPDLKFVFTDYYLQSQLNSYECKLSEMNFLLLYKNHIKFNINDYYILTTQDIIKKYLAYPCICTDTVMLKREIFNYVDYFDETLISTEDTDLWIRIISYINYIGFIDKPLAIYNHYRSQLSSNTKQVYFNRIQFWKKLAKNPQIDYKYIRKNISHLYKCSGIYAIWTNELTYSRAMLIKSIYFNPFNFGAYKYIIKSFFKNIINILNSLHFNISFFI